MVSWLLSWSRGLGEQPSDIALRVLAIIILKNSNDSLRAMFLGEKIFANELSLIRLQRPWNVLVFLCAQLRSVHAIRTFERSSTNRRVGISRCRSPP